MKSAPAVLVVSTFAVLVAVLLFLVGARRLRAAAYLPDRLRQCPPASSWCGLMVPGAKVWPGSPASMRRCPWLKTPGT